MCRHNPPCPAAEAPDREAAKARFEAPLQSWTLLCNGVILFSGTGEVLPTGEVIAPHRPELSVTEAHAVPA
jgi:hypothetical protein